MALITTNDPLAGNYATFINDENEDENKGECWFNTPTYNSTTNKWDVTGVYGYDVQGTPFNAGTLTDIDAESRLNPSKVFKWIVTKIKGVLCPNCM